MNTPKLRIVGLIAAVVCATAGHAHAVPLTDAKIFNQFNAVIFGNFSSSSEVEGRTVVGGNFSASNSVNFEIKSGLAPSSFGALSVYGNVNAAGVSLNVDNEGIGIAGSNNANFGLNGGGSAYVGGNNSGTLAVNGGVASLTVVGSNSGALSLSSGGSVYTGNGNTANITAQNGTNTVAINGNTSGNLSLGSGTTLSLNGSNTGSISLNNGTMYYTGAAGSVSNGTPTHVSSLNLTAPASTLGSFTSTFLTPLTQLSSQLAGVAANSTATLVGQSLTFNANPNSSGVAVFDINTSQFSGASSITLNLDGATSVIINVNVDSCVSNVCSFSPTLNFNDSSYASVLLWNFVNATNLNFTTEFGGSILAPDAAVSDTQPIDGTVVASSLSTSNELHSYPYTGTFPGSVPAPEPASLALFGTGVAALAAIRRRRNRKSGGPVTAGQAA